MTVGTREKEAQPDMKGLTVSDLVAFISFNLKKGHIKPTDKVFLSIDEEGNGFSPVVIRGIEAGEGSIIFFPLKVSDEFPNEGVQS